MTDPKPSETPYLNVRLVDGLLGDAAAVTGNRRALLQLRAQIDRAIADEGYPLDDAIYRDENGQEFEVVVKRARSMEKMREKAKLPKPEKTAEELPWAEMAKRSNEARNRATGPGTPPRSRRPRT